MAPGGEWLGEAAENPLMRRRGHKVLSDWSTITTKERAQHNRTTHSNKYACMLCVIVYMCEVCR